MLVDSHCHLEFDAFEEDRSDAIRRAHAAGVGAMVTICTRLSRFDEVLAVAESEKSVWCSAGIHPHHAAEEQPATGLVARADHPKVVGIGETGLDYHYDNSPRDVQQRSFRAHIAAARETGLPLIVHNRESDGDMAAILEDEAEKGVFPGVLHCFSSSRELARRALNLGFHISISGIVTFRNAQELRDIVVDLPMDRLLVETDSPFLAPVPNRGRRNEPSFVTHVADRIAEIRNAEKDYISEVTTNNFFRLFGKAKRPAGDPANPVSGSPNNNP